MAKKKKRTMSPEMREKARQNALELVRQGKFGGKQPGAGRPRNKRASEIVAEEASKKAYKIVGAFEDALDEHNPASVRLAAAEKWLNVEQSETKLQMEEEKHVDQLQTTQLITLIATKLERLQEQGVFPDIIDAEAIDVIEEGSETTSEGYSDAGEEDWAGWAKE